VGREPKVQMTGLTPFSRDDLSADAVQVARRLLGAVLVSTVGDVPTAGRIVETEAYFGPEDPASHAAARTGRTQRNAPMYGLAGTAYVYRIYGTHRCFNVVTDREGIPSAVLVRALEPLEGAATMTRRRGRGDQLCSGPGRLAQALAIDESLNGCSLASGPVRLCEGVRVPEDCVRVSGRVGVSRAANWPLRFSVDGSRAVSRARTLPASRPPAYLRALAKTLTA